MEQRGNYDYFQLSGSRRCELHAGANFCDFCFIATISNRIIRNVANRGVAGTLNARLNFISAYLVLVAQNVGTLLRCTLRDRGEVRQTGHNVHTYIAARNSIMRATQRIEYIEYPSLDDGAGGPVTWVVCTMCRLRMYRLA